MILEAVQEVHKVARVNATLADDVGDDVAVAVDGSGDRNRLEAHLFLGQKDGSRLWEEPNFWFDLANCEDALVHVEDVLPALNGLHEPSEAHQPTLVLAAKLARGERDVHAGDPLLDAHFSVQLSKAADRYRVIFELFIEVGASLDQALGAPFQKIFAVGEVGHLLLGPGEASGVERRRVRPWEALLQSLLILFQ